MEKCQFKNDGRANPSLVIEHMKKEFERNIRHLTGESVELIVRKKLRRIKNSLTCPVRRSII